MTVFTRKWVCTHFPRATADDTCASQCPYLPAAALAHPRPHTATRSPLLLEGLTPKLPLKKGKYFLHEQIDINTSHLFGQFLMKTRKSKNLPSVYVVNHI